MQTTLTVRATTTDDAIAAAIPFVDMRSHATEVRDMAAAVLAEQGDQEALTVSEHGDIVVLYSPVFGYAYVNERSAGVGDSLIIDNGKADSPEHAARRWADGE